MTGLITIDERLASLFSTAIANSPLLSPIFKVLGVGLVYLIPLVLLWAWFAVSRRAALRAALAGLLAWEGVSKLIANLVDRPRPALSQIGVQELVFHRPDTSFPSDHSAFLMAVAVTFYLTKQPRLGTLCLIVALIVGVTRVGIGVHFPLDILAGLAVGTAVAYLLQAIEQPLDRYVIEPLIALARKLKL